MKFGLFTMIILGILFSTSSCEDLYQPEDIISDGLENMEFDCFEKTSDFFFRGIFGEDSICAYAGENGYKSIFGIGNGFVTLTRTFTLEDLQSQDSKSFVTFGVQKVAENGHGVHEQIKMKAQPMKFSTPLDSMVRAFLVNGMHPVRGVLQDGSIALEGFEILLSKWYENPNLNPDHWRIQCTSALGEQPSNSYVNILDVELNNNGNYVEGFIHLEFSCKMFNENAGKLTGMFVRDFSGEFYLPIKYEL